MRVVLLIAIVCAILCAGTLANMPNRCGDFLCPSTDLCCTCNSIGPYSSQCYNPDTHHCCEDSFSGVPNERKNCLCAKSDKCCNGVCFDDASYYCDNQGKIQQKQRPQYNCGTMNCQGSDKCCDNRQCYSERTQVCTDDLYKNARYDKCVCDNGEKCCNGKCFDPQWKKCNSKGNVVSKW